MNKLTRKEKRLLKYIKKHLRGGISEERIKSVLLKVDWSEDIVDKVMDIAKRKPRNPFSRMFTIELDREKKKKEEESVKKAPEEIKKDIKEKPKSLTEKIGDLNEKIEMLTAVKGKKKKDKSFNLPFWQRGQLKNLAKKSKLLVIYPTVNRGIKTLVTEVKDEWCVIENKPRKVNLDHVFLWQGKYPAIILPEWDIEPFGTKDYYDAEAKGRRSSPAATIIRMIANKEQFNKMNLNPKVIIAAAIGAVIILAVIFGNFGG